MYVITVFVGYCLTYRLSIIYLFKPIHRTTAYRIPAPAFSFARHN